MAVEQAQTTRWARYAHVDYPELQYDVEEEAQKVGWHGDERGVMVPTDASGFLPILYKSPDRPGELCVRFRSIRNHFLANLPGRAFDEENHIPAYTLMPWDHFDATYYRLNRNSE